MKFSKNPFIFALLVILFCLGCGGRTAYPVMVYQYGDEKRSCKGLEMGIKNTELEIQRLIPDTDKTGKNVALGVAGLLIWPIWFAMDFSDAEKIEVNALRQRYNHLVVLATEKECSFEVEPLPPIKRGEEDDDDDSY